MVQTLLLLSKQRWNQAMTTTWLNSLKLQKNGMNKLTISLLTVQARLLVKQNLLKQRLEMTVYMMAISQLLMKHYSLLVQSKSQALQKLSLRLAMMNNLQHSRQLMNSHQVLLLIQMHQVQLILLMKKMVQLICIQNSLLQLFQLMERSQLA